MTPFDARVRALSESKFFAHLGLFVIGVGLAVGATAVVGGLQWVAVGAAGWALILASHATAVFGNVLSTDWIERRAAALVDPLLEAGAAKPPGALDLFDLAAAAGKRPTGPSPRDAAFADELTGSDPFGSLRTPIDTPRLDSPRLSA